MRRWLKAAMPLAVGLMFLGLASCQGDDGPAGPPGTAECMHCHQDDFQLVEDTSGYYLRTIQTQFALSRHNLSDTYVRRGDDASPACSRCHTTEGYQYYLANGQEAPMEESSHISCFACHAPHTNGDFSLRKEGPTEMMVGSTYDKGPSNTCAVCHQARAPEPAIESASPITSSRWGPHHSPQSNILSATGAWVLPGATYRSSHPHNTIAIGCVNCHMADLPANTIAGKHSFAINYESSGAIRVNSKGCTCHGFVSDLVATNYTDSSQARFEEELAVLGDLIVARGWLNPTTGLVVPANAPTNANDRGVLWNYLLLESDLSESAHNPWYAKDIIDAGVAYLSASASH